ncbi:hypothetical protein KKC94_00955, partial [Patescibacteria group bacterium]|nr:hypothetical protein [Patescibacteria group bacterium]
FTSYEITDCSDYFDYIYTPIDSLENKRQGGVVYNIICEGTLDYQESNRSPYGFLIDTEEYGQKRIGIHVLDSTDDEFLMNMNGEKIRVEGELHIQTADPNGAGLFAEKKDIRLISTI